MPRSLPFDTAPTPQTEKIGTPESGFLQFRKINAISIAEREAIVEVDKSNDIFRKCACLVAEIHGKDGEARTRTQIYAELQAAINGVPNELALTMPDQITDLRRQRDDNGLAVAIRKATTMIQNRLQNCSDWTDDDTRELDSEMLILAISGFYDQEMLGVTGAEQLADMANMQKQLEEQLKKLETASGSPPPNLTGPTSTGDAEPPIPDVPSLSASGLAISQSPTSSTPLLPPTNES